jgi:vanillate O-demethylase monooxygenase subunit
MTHSSDHSGSPGGRLPVECWYAVATSDQVVRELLPVRLLQRSVVLYRTGAGEVVALEDRCPHRPYPLSLGRLSGDQVHCGLCGMVFSPRGECVSVPTQDRVPFGGQVHAFPVRERDGLVWLWPGEPGRADLHRVPELPWLSSADWHSVGGSLLVEAGFLLLHESFADVTQVPFVAPEIAPLVLQVAPPRLDVVVTETTVSLRRQFPPGPLPSWQAQALSCAPDQAFEHMQEGHFVSPAVWVDHWDVGADATEPFARMRFSQFVTPIDEVSSRLVWRVSRDFAVADEATSVALHEMFTTYYGRVAAALAAMQRVIDTDGAGPEVNVQADVAALKVRSIVQDMLSGAGAS